MTQAMIFRQRIVFFAFNTILTLRRMHANDALITKLTAMNIGLCAPGIVSQDAL